MESKNTKTTKTTITTKTLDIRPLLTNLNDPVMLRSVEKALQGENVASEQGITSVVDKSVSDKSSYQSKEGHNDRARD